VEQGGGGGGERRRLQPAKPPPFPLLSLDLRANAAASATGRRPARWFNRGPEEATRDEQTEKTRPEMRKIFPRPLH